MDFLSTCGLLGALLLGVVWFLVARCRAKICAWVLSAIVVAFMVAGYFVHEHAVRVVKSDMRRGIIGLAPTYARELEVFGHSMLPTDCAPDDPLYLRLIESQKRWLAVNPAIADIYTWRLIADNKLAFIVDSETDYDWDGKFDSEREKRTPPGEVYENEATELQLKAFAGEVVLDEVVQTDKWGRWISAFAPLRDPHGRIEACVGIDFPAQSWEARISEAKLAVNASLATLVLLALGVGLILGVLKLMRLREVERRAEIVRHTKELENSVAERTHDLAFRNKEFESEMLERSRVQEALSHAQEKLISASRQAGMAEVAASVLHNVGNVLNSANVSIQLIVRMLASSRVKRLVDAGKLLEKNAANLAEFAQSPQGKTLPDYIGKLASHTVSENEKMLEEAKRVSQYLEHIRTIVSRQQGIARCAERRELVEMSDLFEQALSLNDHALCAAGVRIVREFAEVPMALVDKHQVLQILVNLIRNACHALVMAERKDRQITLKIEARPGRMLRLTIEDNGVGIPGENMVKLFNFGFTTKADGNGFGLHHSANTAHQLGGSLSVVSLGEGRGASFFLDIPIDRTAEIEPDDESMANADSASHSVV